MGNKKSRIVRQETENKGSQAQSRPRPSKDMVRCLWLQWNPKETKGQEVGGSSRGQGVQVFISQEQSQDLGTTTSEQVFSRSVQSPRT